MNESMICGDQIFESLYMLYFMYLHVRSRSGIPDILPLWSSWTSHLPSLFGNTPPTQELQREFFLSHCNVVGLPCVKRPQGFLARPCKTFVASRGDFPHFREERIWFAWIKYDIYNRYSCGKTFDYIWFSSQLLKHDQSHSTCPACDFLLYVDLIQLVEKLHSSPTVVYIIHFVHFIHPSLVLLLNFGVIVPKDVVYDSMGLAFIIKLDNVAGDMGVPFFCKKGGLDINQFRGWKRPQIWRESLTFTYIYCWLAGLPFCHWPEFASVCCKSFKKSHRQWEPTSLRNFNPGVFPLVADGAETEQIFRFDRKFPCGCDFLPYGQGIKFSCITWC